MVLTNCLAPAMLAMRWMAGSEDKGGQPTTSIVNEGYSLAAQR
jgi:hypothetical protein